MSYDALVAADRRLAMLRFLDAAPGYSANESLLNAALERIGHAVARDVVRTDAAWLAEQGLVRTEDVGGVMVVAITGRGQDVAAGRARVPGVKRPRAGD